MTERLYYTDSYLTEFESEVTVVNPIGDRFEVSLAQTAFYPTGGGQPHDLGSLGGLSVLDVIDREDAGVVHVIDRPLVQGTRVTGVVDWKRRFDHMQQHSGQHILSAAFESQASARTESFHLGASSCTIDLHRVLSTQEIRVAEDEANKIVWQDREVRLRSSSAAEAHDLPLRKESSREGALRLIEIAGFDLSACGGTHVTRTGVVGVIAIAGWEKFKSGTRVEFVCGGRALGRLREWRDVFSATSRVLSVLPDGLAPAIERLQGENKALAKSVRGFQEQLAGHKAAALVAAGTRHPDGRILVVETIEGWDVSGLKAIATAAAAHPGVCTAIFSDTDPALVVVARSVGVNVDASAVVKELFATFAGKGGGKPEFAQGGGLGGDAASRCARARELLSR